MARGPDFVPEASKNVTALAGRVATLNCRIKNLDNWTVMVDVASLLVFVLSRHSGAVQTYRSHQMHVPNSDQPANEKKKSPLDGRNKLNKY